MTVTELLARTTSRELSEWMLYEAMEPFGERGAYLRIAIVASTLVNLQLKKGAEPVSPEAFMPETMRAPIAPVAEPDPATKLAQLLGLKPQASDE